MSTKEAVALNQMIKESEEYQTYCRTLEKVRENRELYDAMNSFRRRNYDLQSYDDGINRYHEVNQLALEYDKVLHHPDVNAFLIAEQVFSRQMQEIYDLITDGVELDYGYME